VAPHQICTQGAAGSNPAVSTTPHLERGFATLPAPKSAEKAEAHPLHEAVDAFLLNKRVAGCTEATLSIYAWWLRRLIAEIPHVTPLAVRQFFAGLQDRSPSLQHQAYRTLKTFFRWCVEARVFKETPLCGFTMRAPKTLPAVPTGEELRAVLAACSDTLEGTRNRALLLVMADSGLRASELLHLLIEDWRPADRGVFVRGGKGRKDRVSFIGPTTVRSLKAWLVHHPLPSPESFLFRRPARRTFETPSLGADPPPA
jgi:integrase